jgi:hypothetical protein
MISSSVYVGSSVGQILRWVAHPDNPCSDWLYMYMYTLCSANVGHLRLRCRNCIWLYQTTKQATIKDRNLWSQQLNSIDRVHRAPLHREILGRLELHAIVIREVEAFQHFVTTVRWRYRGCSQHTVAQVGLYPFAKHHELLDVDVVQVPMWTDPILIIKLRVR